MQCRREDFDCCRAEWGNESTVNQRPDDGRVAIFVAPSTDLPDNAIFGPRSSFAERLFRLARKDMRMRQFGALLRSTRFRIRRRLADIVAIAAASLPAVGA